MHQFACQHHIGVNVPHFMHNTAISMPQIADALQHFIAEFAYLKLFLDLASENLLSHLIELDKLLL